MRTEKQNNELGGPAPFFPFLIKTYRIIGLSLFLLLFCMITVRGDQLSEAFQEPPPETGTWWFWSNTINQDGVTRDLEAMHQAGIGRVNIKTTYWHTANVFDGRGLIFQSSEHLALFRFALDEIERLGMTAAVTLANGNYQGGPWMTPEIGIQVLTFSSTNLTGGLIFDGTLPEPNKTHNGDYKPRKDSCFNPVATLAFQRDVDGKLLENSRVDLTAQMGEDGSLQWNVPAGNWTIFRFAHSPTFEPIKSEWPGYSGLQIDHLSATAMKSFFKEVGLPIIAAAGPHVGSTLLYFDEDSREMGYYDWTHGFENEFKSRRGYDLIPLLPVVARQHFAGRSDEKTILRDFFQTRKDLLIANHYDVFRDLCHEHGLLLEAEGMGKQVPSSVEVCGAMDVPMGEFWAYYGRPRIWAPPFPATDAKYFNTDAVLGAEQFGRDHNAYEAFTSWAHWIEYPALIKPLAAYTFASGLQRFWLHGFSESNPNTPPPGDIFFAGTHFGNWTRDGYRWGELVFAYFNRIQMMMLQGKRVPDSTVRYFVNSVEVTSNTRNHGISAIERSIGDTRCFFISNQENSWITVDGEFPAPGLQPEVWNPINGEMHTLSLYHLDGDTINLSLRLPPFGSTFVVFRPAPSDTNASPHFTALALNDQPVAQWLAAPLAGEIVKSADGSLVLRTALGGHFTLTDATGKITQIDLPTPAPALDVDEDWKIAFASPRKDFVPFSVQAADLFDWSESADGRVRGFSGFATYTNTFTVPENWLTQNELIVLALGEVLHFAEVTLNGKAVGAVWAPPFELDLTKYVVPGTNNLQIKVSNTWHNWAAANDYIQKLEDKTPQRSFLVPSPFDLRKPLPAGLLGPVQLRQVKRVKIAP